MFIVYGLYDSNDNLFYIGKTTEDRLVKRLTEHRCRANQKDNQKIYNKIRKLLREGTEIKIKQLFSFGTEKEQTEKEIELIALYGRKTRRGGILYNTTDGGEGTVGYIYSKETRAKMSKAKVGNTINLGRKRPDMIDKFSKTVYMYGEDGKMIGEYSSHRIAEAETGLSHKLISDALDRPSRSVKGVDGSRVRFRSTKNDLIEVYEKPSPKSIMVLQYDLEGNLLKEFKDSKVAGRETGINDTGIRNTCNNKAKTAGGFIWQYKR